MTNNAGTAIDISGGSCKFVFNGEGGNIEHAATGFDSDGTDGKTYYQVASATFYGGNVGKWTLNVEYTDGTSKPWTSTEYSFTLYDITRA